MPGAAQGGSRANPMSLEHGQGKDVLQGCGSRQGTDTSLRLAMLRLHN